MKPTEPLATARPILRVNPATGKLQERRFKIEVVSGSQPGRSVALLKTIEIVGSHPDAGLTLEDGSVSRC